MDSKIILFLASFSLLFCNSKSSNITTILDQYPSFSTFNNYLTQTQIANDINSRSTITVLAVDNDNMSPLSGKSPEVIRKIMSVHVILDYYDVKKFQNLANKTAKITTLFQTSGMATGDQGFLNVTDVGGGSVVFGSAVKDAALGSNLVNSVVSQPYNISVLQISSTIVPPGIDSIAPSSPPSPNKAPAPAPRKILPPAKSPPPSAPAEADTPSVAPNADTPAADDSLNVGTAQDASLGIITALISSNLFFMLI